MILSLISASVGVAAALAVLAYTRLSATCASEQTHYSDVFFEASDKLASCDDAPSELLHVLYALNETITGTKAFPILFSYLSDQSRWLPKDKEFYVRNKALAEFFHQRPELEPLYRQVLVGWFLAVTAQSPLIGRLARFALVESAVEGAAFKRIRQGASQDRDPTHGPNQVARA